MADDIRNEDVNDDGVQHGIDDDPNNDPKKARNLGGVGGAVTGLAAGAMAGPVGAVVGAVVGGVAGALGSQAAVGAVDKIDNDNTVSGIGHGSTGDVNNTTTMGNGEPGIQTGGHANDGTPDTRGIMEKTADTVTGDAYDDKTGKRVDGGRMDPAGDGNRGYAYADTPTGVPNSQPGIQTGGRDADGSPDTRGIMEKTADTLTGDDVDDKTGKRVD